MISKNEEHLRKLVDKLVELKIIDENEKVYYLYGLRHLQLLVLITVAVLIMGSVLDELMFSIVFISIFSMLRTKWKGFHARTKEKFFFYSVITFFIGIVIKRNTENVVCGSFFIFSGIVSQLMLLGIIWKSEDRNRKIRGNEILTIVFMVEITAEAFRQKDILYGVWYASVAMVFVWTLGKVRGNHGEKWSYVKI